MGVTFSTGRLKAPAFIRKRQVTTEEEYTKNCCHVGRVAY
jgi:hypothetical protein